MIIMVVRINAQYDDESVDPSLLHHSLPIHLYITWMHPSIYACMHAAKLQSQSGDKYKSISELVAQTLRREGIGGFYRGISAVVVGGVPGVCLYMTSYEEFKHRLQEKKVHPFLSYLLSGVLAEAVWSVSDHLDVIDVII